MTRPPVLTETDTWRTRLAGGGATHLSSHARHPRPATSDKTKGSQAQPGRQPQRESARRPVGTLTSASDITDARELNSKSLGAVARLVVTAAAPPATVLPQPPCNHVAFPKVPAASSAGQVAQLLDSRKIAALVSALEATRWTGRPGYPDPFDGRDGARQVCLRRPDVDSPCGVGFRARDPARRNHRWYPRRAVRLRLLPVYNQAPEVRRHAGPVHRRCDRLPARADARAWPQRRHQRLRHARLRQRQRYVSKHGPEREALHRSGRLLGPPLRCLNAQG